jgi:hypothetical protein
MRKITLFFILLIVTISTSNYAVAQDRYGGSTRDLVPTSPKQGWSEIEPTQVNEGTPVWSQVLMWLPNRLLDLIDVFRIDVGVGPSFGAVVRATKYGQVGYRQMAPASLRVGDFGRQMPILVEASNELGVGPAFIESKDRSVCAGEFGVGADLLVAGAYGGVCVDEFADFIAGIFFIDLKDDDL